ncbi:hypothetical protein EV175_002096 [Coemansia sp. RSA 1933]|nr:hypothetical protein EV175_002096 [Coemansia sp. RSA 1933]
MSRPPAARPNAWAGATSRTSAIHTYIKQTLSSGMISCATQGHFRSRTSSCSKEIVAAIGSSLVLLDSAMSMICEAPVYANIISLETFVSPGTGGESTTCTKDMCAVLTESGHASLIYVEEIGTGRYRFRLCDEIKVSCYLDQALDDMSQPLRKILKDPYSRAVGFITWTNSLELLLLDWSSIGTQSGPENICPLHHCIGLKTDIGDAILDAAILVPLDPEPQRILVVAAIVVTEPYQQFCLSLYETWTRRSVDQARFDPSLKLLENLPLPPHTTAPLHIIPLPAFPECFLLLTHDEIVFVSSLQILSGDVFLHRVKLPDKTKDGGSDPVHTFCIAGSTRIANPSSRKDRDALRALEEESTGSASGPVSPRSPTSPDQSHGRSASSMLVQKLYLTTQNGRLYRMYVSSKPFIEVTEVSAEFSKSKRAGGSGAFPAGDTLIHIEPNEGFEDLADRLFVSGDCTDHSMISISEHQTGSAAGLARTTLGQQITPVLDNHCPVTSLILQRDKAYWTSGRATTGSVQQAQFGHMVQIETALDMSIGGDKQSDGHIATRLWALNRTATTSGDGAHACVNMNQKASRQLPRVVLHNECSGIPVVEDEPGNWQIDASLLSAVSDPGIVLISDFGSTGLLRISRQQIDVVAADRNEPAEMVLASTPESEPFIHGTCCYVESRGMWLIAAATRGTAESSRVVITMAQKTGDKGLELICPVEKAIHFDTEVACLRSFALRDTSFLVVGTHDCKVHVYRLDDNATYVLLDASLPISEWMRTAYRPHEDTGTNDAMMDVDIESTHLLQIESHWIPNDVYLLSSNTSMHVLVGLRDGHMVLVAVSDRKRRTPEGEAAHQAVIGVTKTTVGLAPVSFVQLPELVTSYSGGGGGHILQVGVVTDSLYIASLEELGLVRITPCYVKDEPLQPLRSLVPIANNVAETRRWRHFAIHQDGNASILTIPVDKQCYLHDFNVGDEPRQLVLDDDTGMMLVAGVIFSNSLLLNVPPTSYLRVLDPNNGGQLHADIRFHAYEMVHSLATWHIHGQKRYRYICVGTGLYMDQTGGGSSSVSLNSVCSKPRGGRLAIYNLKQTKRKSRTKPASSPRLTSNTSLDQMSGKGGYELKYVWESERDSPVVALAPLGDSYLVVGVGKMCVVLKLDVAQKRLIECCETPLRFPITSLDVRGHSVVAGSQREAVNILRFVPAQSDDDYDRLLLQNSARFGVNTADACYLSDSTVVGVDSSGFVYAVEIPAPGNEFGLDCAFGFHVGTECSRIRQGCLVRRVYRPKHVLPWTDGTRTSKVDDSEQNDEMLPEDSLVVSTISGAMWTLVRISRQAYVLLKELEHVMCALNCSHPARPLLAPEGSIDRARRKRTIGSSNVIDGTLATTFLTSLTASEQVQVVTSSETLQHLALEPGVGDGGCLDQEAALRPDERAVQIICRLVSTINSACTC